MTDQQDLHPLRHSTSHIMASAVKELFPSVKLAIGPPTADGFYYDFSCAETVTETDLPRIEARMRQIIARDDPFERQTLSRAEAVQLFQTLDEPYKLELIAGIPEGEEISIYRHGAFVDLCEGPHLRSTGGVAAFKLLSLAGAYWRGSERNPMLQRIYGTAFPTGEALEQFLTIREQAKLRDHRKLGRELELFSFEEEAGAGMVFYHPKGALLRMLIEDFVKAEHLKRGYQLVATPHLLRGDIWRQSGHLDYYRPNMFLLDAEGVEYAVKPMNCPGHVLIYRAKTRSYRELPLRLFELGTVYRHEKSGVLHGLLRVRGFTQDDAHLFCRPEQVVEEIRGVLAFMRALLGAFGFTAYRWVLSTRPRDAIGSDETWGRATTALRTALEQEALPYEVEEGGGAFYGPKIDMTLTDALGRPWQCATIQCDFALPDRFALTYVGPDGKPHRPIMLHRAVLGSLERFLATLLEHYAGALPVWLSPVQVCVIPIGAEQQTVAEQVCGQLTTAGLRATVDARSEKMQARIREAELQKIPYMLVIGAREAAAGTVAVRSRAQGDEGAVPLAHFVERITAEQRSRA